MGWKASFVVASQDAHPRLAEGPAHSPELADRFVATLAQKFQPVGPSTFETGGFPYEGNLHVGAYEGSLIVGDLSILPDYVGKTTPAIIERVNAFLPGAKTLALGLHSVVNYYNYALFDGLRLVRARGGSADEGVVDDVGDPLPEEAPLLNRAVLNSDGEVMWNETFDGVVEEFDHSAMGEEFVFEVARRFFGERLDAFDHDILKMSEYRRERRWPWRLVLGP